MKHMFLKDIRISCYYNGRPLVFFTGKSNDDFTDSCDWTASRLYYTNMTMTLDDIKNISMKCLMD